jgi:hypothetical protein
LFIQLDPTVSMDIEMAKPGPQWCFVCGSNAPAIWLYPEHECDVVVRLAFHSEGFMTTSRPNYNSCWHIHVDPSAPFDWRTKTYFGDGPRYPFLDYDGFREGDFQRESGWLVPKDRLMAWQREHLSKLGYTEAEIDDVNYSYGRLLLEQRYEEKYFVVYPQAQMTVDRSVTLHISPSPDTLHRMWLYFVPTDAPPPLKEPVLVPIKRTGFTVVELGVLTDFELADSNLPCLLHGRA